MIQSYVLRKCVKSVAADMSKKYKKIVEKFFSAEKDEKKIHTIATNGMTIMLHMMRRIHMSTMITHIRILRQT